MAELYDYMCLNLSGCVMTQPNVATQIFLEAGDNAGDNAVLSTRTTTQLWLFESNVWSDPFSDDQE